MHKIRLNPEVEARVRARRGGDLHVFKSLDAKKTAFVVIDMQDGFVADGHPAMVKGARDIVPNLNRLAKALREKGGTVVWVKMVFDEQTKRSWSTFLTEFTAPQMQAALMASLGAGMPGTRLWHELDVRPCDPVVPKQRFSAFFPGSSDIDNVLKGRGIDTLVIGGTLTNVCCESTARDASMMNYRTVFLSDGNAAQTDEEHNAALSALMALFCDVMTTDECIARLGAAAGARAAE